MNKNYFSIHGWGNTKTVGVDIKPPKNLEQIKKIIKKSARESTLARGLGRSDGDSAQLEKGTILKLTEFKKIKLNKERSELTVGAGVSFEEILKYIVPLGFFLPVVPGTKFITLGGAIASDVHGKNHHKDGSFGNFLKRVLILNSSSEIIEIGPNQPFSKDEIEMFWATVGGLGLTGIIIEATFSLKKISTSFMKVHTMRFNNIDSMMRKMIETDEEYEYSVAWIDSLNKNIRGILTCANHATENEVKNKKINEKLIYKTKTSLNIHSFFNVNLINNLSIKLFNELWFRRAHKKNKSEIQTISKFFHPLDGLQNWNKLYGKKGFYQYQFVVPDESKGLIKKLIKELKQKNIPSFLCVLKRLGDGNNAMLSFPIKGWTLSLDFPSSNPKILPLLNKYDELIQKAGGKIYLAKDARLSPKIFRKIYNRIIEWNKIRDRMDKNNLFQSDISKRLKIIQK